MRLENQSQGARPFDGLHPCEKRPARRSRRGKQRVHFSGQPVSQKPDPLTDAVLEHNGFVDH
jgi:hypothetical protein